MRYITIKVNSEIYLEGKKKRRKERHLKKIPCSNNWEHFIVLPLSGKYMYSLKPPFFLLSFIVFSGKSHLIQH